MDVPIHGLTEINRELCLFSDRWMIDGDYIRCRKCKRPQLTSYMDWAFPHSEGCKAIGAVEVHPWRTYLGVVNRLTRAALAAKAAT